MFEKHHAKVALEHYEAAHQQWASQVEGTRHYLALVTDYQGSTDSELMLAAGEALFFKVSGAALIEERKGPGTYVGRSSGVSVPIGSIGGHSIRYRVGANRGHFVQGEPYDAAVDSGTCFVTNRRVIFQGQHQTRECSFGKLIGFHHDSGETTFSVSNRQKPTTIHYGAEVEPAFDFYLDLALAHFRGTLDALRAQLQADLNNLEAAEPVPPATAVPEAEHGQHGQH